MNTEPAQVVGIGQCSFDLLGRIGRYPAVDEKVEMSQMLTQGGGPVATALVALARLGVATAFCGRIGDDGYGLRIREGLIAAGVDCRGLLCEPGATSQFAFVAVEEDSGRRNIFWHRGSARPLTGAELEVGGLAACRVLHLDGRHVEAALAAAQQVRRQGGLSVLDGGTLNADTERLLPLIDHAVISQKFARQLHSDSHRAALDSLLARGATAATVTCGAGGCHTLSRAGEFFSLPAFAVQALDTTGCGDVFHGGYIYGLLQGWPLRRTVRFAAACAALKTRALGGRTAIPTLAEVEGFLADQDFSPKVC
ncbi:MAG: PfkB family carbohydrate kinase [Desulfuromonadaceae bacterium]|jgi:sulfofructose kinase